MIYQDNWTVQSPILKKNICKKCLAKLDNGKEFIFVNILYIKKNGDIVGNITNNIISTSNVYKLGDLVYFQRKNIIELLTFQERKEKATKMIPDIMKMCMMYREDFVRLNDRIPTKEEMSDYFDKHINIF